MNFFQISLGISPTAVMASQHPIPTTCPSSSQITGLLSKKVSPLGFATQSSGRQCPCSLLCSIYLSDLEPQCKFPDANLACPQAVLQIALPPAASRLNLGSNLSRKCPCLPPRRHQPCTHWGRDSRETESFAQDHTVNEG